MNRIGGCVTRVLKQGAAHPTVADGVLLFNKMDVFTYRLPAFQAFPAAHSLSRELHHLATLSVPRTVHTDSHDMEHLTAQTEALCLRSCLVHLCVREIACCEESYNVTNSSRGRNLHGSHPKTCVGTISTEFP